MLSCTFAAVCCKTELFCLQVPEGVQNTAAEVSELQLMAENQADLETAAEADPNDDSPPHTG